jgi:hypothetical protein
MADAPKTKIFHARGFQILNAQNGTGKLLVKALLEDGSSITVLAPNRLHSPRRFAGSDATDLAKVIAEHEANGMPPTKFTIHVHELPEKINPATNKPYPLLYVLKALAKTPRDPLRKASTARNDAAR